MKNTTNTQFLRIIKREKWRIYKMDNVHMLITIKINSNLLILNNAVCDLLLNGQHSQFT